MSHPPITVRAAQAEDLEAIASLFGQLGYSNNPVDLGSRWAGAFAASDAQVLVASSGQRVLGVVVINYLAPLHAPRPWALISALVVDEAARGAGVGAKLLVQAEQAAMHRECEHVELSRSEKRLRAHQFYLHHGYAEIRKRFVKVLPIQQTALLVS